MYNVSITTNIEGIVELYNSCIIIYMTRKSLETELKARKKPQKQLVAYRLPQDLIDAMAAIQKSTGADKTAVAETLIRAGLREWDKK